MNIVMDEVSWPGLGDYLKGGVGRREERGIEGGPG